MKEFYCHVCRAESSGDPTKWNSDTNVIDEVWYYGYTLKKYHSNFFRFYTLGCNLIL